MVIFEDLIHPYWKKEQGELQPESRAATPGQAEERAPGP